MTARPAPSPTAVRPRRLADRVLTTPLSYLGAAALCTRRELSGPGLEQLRTFIVGAPDWERLVRLALGHRVTPQVGVALATHCADIVPEEILSAFQARLDAIAERNRGQLEELLRILSALSAEGIETLVFKGAPLALQAYGDLSLREFRDNDLLVHEVDNEASIAVIRSLGYETPLPERESTRRAFLKNGGQVEMRSTDGFIAEPHWAFSFYNLALCIDYEAIFARAHALELGGTTIQVLSPEDRLLLQCLHGCKEQWLNLRQVCDVGACLAAEDLDWDAVRGRAVDWGCDRMLNIGLLLADELLASTLPSSELSRAQQDRTAAKLCREVLDKFEGTQGWTVPEHRFQRFRFLMRERWRDRWRYSWRTLLRPDNRHLRLIELPRPLFPLYYLIKPAWDYLLLPLRERLQQRGG
jgi:hypothetical protein